MDKIKDGGPAFPMPGMTGLPNGEFVYGDHGMTLRDYFAAKAMQGYLASMSPHTEPAEFASRIAEDAYTIADAMLAAREGKS